MADNKNIRKTKIVHISDTHLGFKAYRYTGKDTSLNQRELDNYDCFKRAIDKILRLKPQFVLHTGDLFDSTRPSNHTLDFTIEQLSRITDNGIKVILLAGNHCTPKVHEQSHVFKLFRHFEGFYPLYKGLYEKLSFDNTFIHAVSQSISEETYLKELNKIEKAELEKGKTHILMLHGALSGFKEFSMNEFNELSIAPSVLKDTFDYIALGHYHNKARINPVCYYAGSLMPLTFGEANQDKGILAIDLENKKIDFHKIESRLLLDLPIIEAKNLDLKQLEKKLESNVGKVPEGSICRQKVNNLNIEENAQPNKNALAAFGKSCLHYQLNINLEEEAELKTFSENISNLEKEFINYLSLLKTKKRGLKELGLKYLLKADEVD